MLAWSLCTAQVVQGLVQRLTSYGVESIIGIRYGLRGFYEHGLKPVRTPAALRAAPQPEEQRCRAGL